MIPLQLHIKNFLSYGSETQTIDFGAYPLICLSGKNGHGKSALLDAITWAVWGQARKVSGTAKPDQGLLHLGQTQMMVSLDFICNSTHYRIKREYMQTYGKPLAQLEFGIIEQDTAKWIPLSEKTIRGTQEVIEQTLRLGYESFINSAFLRQGQSHEFSTKSPKERKEILACILGLQEYELVRRQALEKARKIITEKQGLQLYQEKLGQELQKKTELTGEHANLLQTLANTMTKEQEHIKQQQSLETSFKKMQQEQQQLSLHQFSLQQLLQQEQESRQQLRTARDTWRTLRRTQFTANMHELDNNKQQLMQQLAQHQKNLQTTLELREQCLAAKEHVQEAERKFRDSFHKHVLEAQTHSQRVQITFETLKKTKKDLEQEIITKKSEITKATDEVTTLKKSLQQNFGYEQKYATLEKQFEKRKSFYHGYRTQGTALSNELELLQQKRIMALDENNPSCPLCEQNLSASRKKFLASQFSTQERFIAHRLKRLTALIASLKDLLLKQHKELEQLRVTQEQHVKNTLQLQELEKQQQKLAMELRALQEQQTKVNNDEQKAQSEFAEMEKHLKNISATQENELAQDKNYREKKNTYEQVLQQLETIKYDQRSHEQVTNQLKLVEQQLAEFQNLQRNIALQENRKQEIFQLCARLKQLKIEKKVIEATIASFKNLHAELTQLQTRGQELAQTTTALRQERELLLQKKGSVELEIQRLATLEKTYQEQQKTITHIDAELADYHAIATATSKDGVQALLIEQALPEIEYEANELLSKLTNNQAHIIIDSLRDLKKGGTRETLDIKISDAAGIRPYELFSGGEAFRIDFALRIAVSKLLARRAGTSLQTLIIDEGFGSQDEEGLAHIMDSIYKIQDDFAKVIIVSHLPTMKDNFPVHFYVEKKAQGSFVTVIEQE